jgi:hypothetical protein
MTPGSRVRFKAHGETGLPHVIITRDGDDCSIQDERGRVLRNVPAELLAPVADPDATIKIAPVTDGLWREVDEQEAG